MTLAFFRLLLLDLCVSMQENNKHDMKCQTITSFILQCCGSLSRSIGLHPNFSLDRLKTWLVSKGYSQIHVVDCQKTYSPATKFLRIFDTGQHIFGFSGTDWEGSPVNWRSIALYCLVIRGNHISWRSKKQSIVSRINSRSSAEFEYVGVANITCEIVWI